jgi:hypothetical protein
MRKREFIKKAGLVSATLLVTPSLGFGAKPSGEESGIAAGNNPSAPMKLVIGSDHAGFPLKGPLVH